jgi:hypothetical protein
MVAMSKQKKPQKPKPMNATASKHKGRQLPARVDKPMWDTLERLAKGEDRKVAQMVVVLLKEALTARGKWPPANAGPGGE